MAKGPPVSASPERLCVGCRTRAQQGELLRVVLVEGRLVPDERRNLSGRGAYVHRSRECVLTAIKRKAFTRALRTAGPVDTTELTAAVESMTDREV